MLEYFVLDQRDFGLPVYPVAVLSHAARLCTRSAPPLRVNFPDKRVLDFNFGVIDLARLDARKFVRTRNPAALALSARMKFPARDRILLARDFSINLTSARMGPGEQDLVIGFFYTYQPLTMEERLKLNRELAIVDSEKVREKAMKLPNPYIDMGRHEGEVTIVLRMLNRRVGTLSVTQRRLIEKLEDRQIRALADSLLDFQSRADLTRWLERHSS